MKTVASAISCVLCLLAFGQTQAQETGVPTRLDEKARVWKALATEHATLAQRFGSYAGGLWYQQTGHRDGTGTMLVYSGAARPRPILFGLSRDGTLAWRHDAPLPNPNRSYAYSPRLASDGSGNVLVVWYDTAPRGIHARQFDAQGQAVWTRHIVSEDDHVSSLNVLFWP